jgi:hypothetical protein
MYGLYVFKRIFALFSKTDLCFDSISDLDLGDFNFTHKVCHGTVFGFFLICCNSFKL